jgi:hypothetical protein
MREEDSEYGNRRRQSRRKPGDLVFVACLLICIGIGITLNQVAVAVLIGLGAGFISMAIIGWRNEE